MIALGLLIAAAAGAFAALLIAYNTSGGPEYTVSMFDQDMVTLNSLAIFCAGLAIALIFCAGLALAATGPRTRRRLSGGRRRQHYAVTEGTPTAQQWQADTPPQRAEAPRPGQEPPEPPINTPHNR